MNMNGTVKKLEEALQNPVASAISGIQEFSGDSIRFFNKCTKPDEKEFMKILKATILGFLVMGVMGFLIKLLFIPINNVFLGF